MPAITVSEFCKAIKQLYRWDFRPSIESLEITQIIKRETAVYGYYPEMTLLEFFMRRKPTPEHDPITCANTVAAYLNVSAAFELKDLVIA